MIPDSMKTLAIASFLKEKVDPFRNFPTERLQSLAAGSHVGAFEAQEAVAHQGDEATYFGVVLSGNLQGSVVGDGGARQALGQLHTGDTINELAFMISDTALADFFAGSSCEALAHGRHRPLAGVVRPRVGGHRKSRSGGRSPDRPRGGRPPASVGTIRVRFRALGSR